MADLKQIQELVNRWGDLTSTFYWKEETTPYSSLDFVVTAIITYLFGILSLKLLLGTEDATAAKKEKARPKNVFAMGTLIPAIHNLNLCIGSLVMFLGTAHAALLESSKPAPLDAKQPLGPVTWLFCFPPGTEPKGRLFFWSYIYYLSKYYELLDTLILVLKRKRIIFLHVYHHATVIIMCFLWLRFSQSVQFVGLLFNTGIHVVMYWYYFMSTIGRPPRWRMFVTNSQIIQFMCSFLASIPFVYLWWSGHGCAGFNAWLFNVGFNLTLLLLFIDFHRRNYGARKSKAGSKKD